MYSFKNTYKPLEAVFPRRFLLFYKTKSTNRYQFGFNGQLKDNEIYGEGNAYDFGDREFDPRSLRWFSIDPKTKKYPSFSPYHFGANSPLAIKDHQGKEWIIGYVINPEDKSIVINITVTADLLNSDANRSDINLTILKQDIITNFCNIFDNLSGVIGDYSFSVNASLQINIIGDKSQNDGKRHLIEIESPDKFPETEAKGTFIGGLSHLGGLHVRINSKGIIDSKEYDKRTTTHEIGHTGGLIHLFEYSLKEYNTRPFINGKVYDTKVQQFEYVGDDLNKINNFMNYSGKVHESLGGEHSNLNLNYIENNPGKVHTNQIRQILQNSLKGNLNTNDIK